MKAGGKLKKMLIWFSLPVALAFAVLRIVESFGPSPRKLPQENFQSASTEEKEAPAQEKTSRTANAPKALTWEDYLSYNPFEGRDQENPKLYALASAPSPFGAGKFSAPGAARSADEPPAFMKNLNLSLILYSPERPVAVINGVAHRVGETLRDTEGQTTADPEFGIMKIRLIKPHEIVLEASGEPIFLRIAEDNDQKKQIVIEFLGQIYHK